MQALQWEAEEEAEWQARQEEEARLAYEEHCAALADEDTEIEDTSNATAHGRAVASTVQQIVGRDA